MPGSAARANALDHVVVVLFENRSLDNVLAELTAGYGLIVADECHHVPAAAFEHAVKQIPARRRLGLTATPYRRDKLDDLIAMQVGRSGTPCPATQPARTRFLAPAGPPPCRTFTRLRTGTTATSTPPALAA